MLRVRHLRSFRSSDLPPSFFSVWDSAANPFPVRRGIELGVRNVGRAGPEPGLGTG